MIGPRALLDHPWYIPYEERITNPPYNMGTQLDGVYGPVTFGKNSTKSIIAEAVAQGLTEIAAEGVTPHKIPYFFASIPPRGTPDDPGPQAFIQRGITDLAEYLTTSGSYNSQYYSMPWSGWEFIHPELPIVRVIAESETVLPLVRTGELPTANRMTRYRVGFVISFQQRWQSFDDPNRWLLRFRETKTLHDPDIWMQRDIAPEEEHGHRFWHHSDYMQHRIIGPIWVEVLESGIMEPGIASVTPRISQWQAPGPIVPDEHLMAHRVEETSNDAGQRGWNRTGDPHLKLRHAGGSPNPGHPLPYHVTAWGPHHDLWERASNLPGDYDQNALPGSDVWNEYCQHDYFRQAFTCP